MSGQPVRSEATGVPAMWIEDGEKYALVGLSVKTDQDVRSGQVSEHLSVLSETRFKIPDHWREWLGTIRTDNVRDCTLFLLSKLPTSTPDILDEENNILKQRVWNFYVGLLLASPFASSHEPVVLTGSRRGAEIDIRQHTDLLSPVPCVFRPYPAVASRDLKLAADLGEKLSLFPAAQVPGGHWRLFRTLDIYVKARTIGDIVDRLHQYCRCIDGLILPSAGETKKQFKSRTELFIGPRHHELMGEIYDVRSAVEHLHENRYLEGFDREVRLDLLKKEAIIEYVARKTLAKVIGTPAFWQHFGNTTALGQFWALDSDARKAIWGAPFDPLDAVADFNPAYIHNGLLGA